MLCQWNNPAKEVLVLMNFLRLSRHQKWSFSWTKVKMTTIKDDFRKRIVSPRRSLDMIHPDKTPRTSQPFALLFMVGCALGQEFWTLGKMKGSIVAMNLYPSSSCMSLSSAPSFFSCSAVILLDPVCAVLRQSVTFQQEFSFGTFFLKNILSTHCSTSVCASKALTYKHHCNEHG